MPADDDRPDVLSQLPHARPQRRSAKRGAPPAKARTKAAPKRDAAREHPRVVASEPPGEPPRSIDPPTGAEILQTAARAAGEVVQVGLAVGRQALRSAISRIPHP